MFTTLELHIWDKELIISTRDHSKEELALKYGFPYTAGMFLRVLLNTTFNFYYILRELICGYTRFRALEMEWKEEKIGDWN